MSFVFDFRPYQKPDWDGEGAAPIKRATIDRARNLATALGECRISPGHNGGVCLAWSGDGGEVFAVVRDDLRVQLYIARDHLGRKAEMVFPLLSTGTV